MRTNAVLILLIVNSFVLFAVAPSTPAQGSGIAVFYEDGFPVADSAAPSQAELAALIAGARFVSANQLHDALSDPSTHLLVVPYGSAYPESAWPDMFAYLERGGNLLALGGRPFTRAAYRDNSGWHLRAYSVRNSLELLIDQYQETPGSDGYGFEDNPDVVQHLPRFSWQQAFSPMIHLTSSDIYNRDGSAARLDARLDALAWGTKDGRRMSAPAIQIDHVRDRFAGGRWIFLNAVLADGFYSSAPAKQIVPSLVFAALRGAEEFTVRPALPLYLPGEPVELKINWRSAQPAESGLSVRVTIASDHLYATKTTQTITLPAPLPVVIPPPKTRGLFTVSAELLEGSQLRAIYHSGFWIRDEAYLRSGPHLSVNPIISNSMAILWRSSARRTCRAKCSAFISITPTSTCGTRIWTQIHDAGLNMIRTGWWTGWDKFCDENGQPYERTLRTLEAYLMTARKNGLPVQFNFFAFLPDVLGGTNAFLDPEAVRRQQTLISSMVARFHDVPYLAWDLINEPSFSEHLWTTRPNGDPIELAAWNQWLSERYPDRAKLAARGTFRPLLSAERSLCRVPTN